MRAASLLGILLMLAILAVAALLAAYVPLKLLGLAGERKLDSLTAGVFAFISIAAGAVIAILAVVFGIPFVVGDLLSREVGDVVATLTRRRQLEEMLAAYRARQRAMLEELDEVKKLLEEIRDLLKEGVGA